MKLNVLTKSLVGNVDDVKFISSAFVTLVTGTIPAGKSNRFHVTHAVPAVGTFPKK